MASLTDILVYFKINGKEPPNELDLRLTSFKFVAEDGMLRKAVFTFDNSDSILEEKEYQALLSDGNLIQFQHGYIDNLSRKYKYVMKGFKGFKQKEVTCYPNIKNIDTDYDRTFPQNKVTDVAKKMAGEMGLKTDKISTLDFATPNLKQNNESNAKFLKKWADKLGWEFGIDDQFLIFRPKNFDASPIFEFEYRSDKYESGIIDFTCDQNTKGLSSQVKLNTINMVTGKPIKINENNDTVKRVLLGSNKTFITAGNNGKTGGATTTITPKTESINRSTLEVN